MKTSSLLIALSLSLAPFAAHADDGDWDVSKMDMTKLPPASAQKAVTYAKDIHSLFEASCIRCHGADRQKGELRLDSLEATLKGGEDGKMIVPGQSAKSALVAAVAQINEDVAMPPKRRGGGPGGPGGDHGPATGGGPRKAPSAQPLTAEQVGLVRAWIDQGAK